MNTLRFFILFGLSIALTVQCSQQDDESNDQSIYDIADQMPRFPGCEEEPTDDERRQCATKNMIEFIFKDLKYPAQAREDSIQGLVIITFVVEKDGELTNFEIKEDIGGGCGEESLRVVKNFPQPWTPGLINNQVVRVRFNLPIRFRLE